MVDSQDELDALLYCNYCKKARAVHNDHIMPIKRLRKEYDFYDTVPACFACNMRKSVRHLVPFGYPRLEELRELTGLIWREWNGDPKSKAFTELMK